MIWRFGRDPLGRSWRRTRGNASLKYIVPGKYVSTRTCNWHGGSGRRSHGETARFLLMHWKIQHVCVILAGSGGFRGRKEPKWRSVAPLRYLHHATKYAISCNAVTYCLRAWYGNRVVFHSFSLNFRYARTSTYICTYHAFTNNLFLLE